MANCLCEFDELDEVWFLITPHNPLKNREELLDDRLRLELGQAAVAAYPRFKVSDFEFSLPQPSYTIDALHALKSCYPDHQFHFIMGADNWAQIDRWKNPRQLIEEFPIVVYPRKGYEIEIPAEYSRQVRKVNAPLMEISSTFIRESYQAGKDVRFFLPEAIRDRVKDLFTNSNKP